MRIPNGYFPILSGILLLFLFAQPLVAESHHVEVSLVSEVKTIQPGQPFWVAVQFLIAPEWHIYWKNPGDSGLAPEIQWKLSSGLTAGELHWPHPSRIRIPPLTSYGYENTAYLFTRIYPSESIPAGSTTTIRAEVNWLECKIECLPGSGEVALDLVVLQDSPEVNEAGAALLKEKLLNLPLKTSAWDVSVFSDKAQLVLELEAPDEAHQPLEELYFYPNRADLIDHSADQFLVREGEKYRLFISRSPLFKGPVTEVRGVLVRRSGWEGPNTSNALQVDEIVQPLQAAGLNQTERGFSNVWIALLFAFFGGMILNLMPCVLPVLSLKILGFIKDASDAPSRLWKHGLLFTLGVLTSFWTLSIILISVRAAGAQVGWGFQLQSPVFVGMLAFFFFLFALNLFGIFEVGVALTGAQNIAAGKSGFFATFLTGALTVVVATPCTAPFMGSAIGYALTQSNAAAILVFTFLGLGLSVPYLFLSLNPSLLRFIPRPGGWMVRLKQFFGFILMGAAIWLLWVFGLQTGLSNLMAILFVLLGVALSGWIYGNVTSKSASKIMKRTVLFVFIGILFLAALAIFSFSKEEEVHGRSMQSDGRLHWQPFSSLVFSNALKQERPVFIDFTAAWCLTCQVNEKLVLESDSVAQNFKQKNVLLIKADWTKRDEEIGRAIQRFGRNSVPLYVLYGRDKTKAPLILPELITADIIIDALEQV